MPQAARARHNLRPAQFAALLVMRGPLAVAAIEALCVRVPQPESPAHALPTIKRCFERLGPASDSASTFRLLGAMLLDKDRRGIPCRSGWTEEPKWRKELRKKPSTEESYLVRQKRIPARVESKLSHACLRRTMLRTFRGARQ